MNGSTSPIQRLNRIAPFQPKLQKAGNGIDATAFWRLGRQAVYLVKKALWNLESKVDGQGQYQDGREFFPGGAGWGNLTTARAAPSVIKY